MSLMKIAGACIDVARSGNRHTLLLVTTTLPWPPLGLVLSLEVIPRVVLVVGPWTMLVLGLDFHVLWELSDKMSMLPAMIAHARGPLSVLPIHVHALKPLTQQYEIFLIYHIELLIWYGHKTR
jgi:hypothetical protein